MEEVEKFLPYINNWATCDMMSPKIFKKHKERLLVSVRRWISSDETYTVRYGIGMLMRHFLDEDFREEYLALAAGIPLSGVLCEYDDRLVFCHSSCKAV